MGYNGCLLWAVSIRQPIIEADFRLAMQTIQAEEVTRIERFVFRDDQLCSLAGRLLLSFVQHLGCSWSEMLFKRTEKWKPYLCKPTDKPNFSVNVSHQGDFVILGTSCGKQIGVDVMEIKNRRRRQSEPADKMINNLEKEFSQAELSKMRSQTDDIKKFTFFYRYWCLKESVIKATGVGIHKKLGSLDFRLASDELSSSTIVRDTKLIENGVPQNQWTFEECMVDGNHCAAVCREADAAESLDGSVASAFRHVSFGELLKDSEIITPLADDAAAEWQRFSAKKSKPF